MTQKEYREAEGISRSELQLFRKSPAHYLFNKNNPQEKTKSLIFGSAAHKYILERDTFFDEFCVMPVVDRRTKEGKEIWAGFENLSVGKQVISQDDMRVILDMDSAIDRHPIARALLTGRTEQSFFWNDPDTDEICKCRPDVMTEWNGKKYIVDYKTTSSCQNGHFERSCKEYGYQLQAGMYQEGVFLNEFEDYGFIFVAQEKTAPYSVRVYFATQDWIDLGNEEFKALLGLFHRCQEEGTFPGYEGFDNEVEYLTEGD